MPKADYTSAKIDFPSISLNEKAWIEFFQTSLGSHSFGRIVGDIYGEIRAQEEKKKGNVRVGRRATLPVRPFDEVIETVFPQQYTMEPFHVAFKEILEGRSQKEFAAKVPMSQPSLSRILSGSKRPNMGMIESMATAAHMNPSYFVEYRALWLSKLVMETYIKNPNLLVKTYKQVRSGRRVFDNRSVGTS